MYNFYSFYDGVYPIVDPYIERELDSCKDDGERQGLRIVYAFILVLLFMGILVLFAAIWAVFSLIFGI